MGKAYEQPFDSFSLADFRRPAMDFQDRLAQRAPLHLYIPPVDSPADSNPQGLHQGLLGAEAGGEMGSGMSLPEAVADFARGKDLFLKPFSPALQSFCNPTHPDQVKSDAVDHLSKYQILDAGYWIHSAEVRIDLSDIQHLVSSICLPYLPYSKEESFLRIRWKIPPSEKGDEEGFCSFSKK
jgi:hypothetical protein